MGLALNELRESVAAFRDVASSGEQGMPLRMAKMRVAQATKAAAAAGIDQEIIVEASKPPEPPPEPEKPKEEAPEPETSADGKKMVREQADEDEDQKEEKPKEEATKEEAVKPKKDGGEEKVKEKAPTEGEEG